MKRSNCYVLVLVLSVFGLISLFSSCGGGGDGSSMTLSGTWVSDCFSREEAWAWEKYVFDGKAGEFTGFLEEFPTSDCSAGSGVILQTTSGTYSTGDEVSCASGYDGNCMELDITNEEGSTRYFLYSVFEDSDPDYLHLSSGSEDPAARSDDIQVIAQSRLWYVPCPGNTGEAIIGLAVTDTGYSSTPSAPGGYTVLDLDLNGGTLGTYVWLSYKMGRADGLEGTPIGRIYTVHESDDETPLSGSDVKLPANLMGTTAVNNFLYIYYSAATTNQVVRCVVVANETDDATLYGPPSAAGLYSITWVEELDPDSSKIPSEYPQPPDAQDLNEGFGGDWIFLGYGLD